MTRILTALLLIPVFVYVVLWSPFPVLCAVAALVALFCFREYANLVAEHKIKPPGLFGYAAGLVLMFVPQNQVAFAVIFVLLAMMLSLRLDDLPAALPFASALVLGVFYIFGGMRFAIELRSLSPYWLLFALSLNWAGDSAALYVGRSFGRHKLSPQWSPGKSWEGSIGSVAASMLYAGLFLHYLLPAVPVVEGLLIGFVANIAGQFGDICESALKRGAGVKDSGAMLPGHGGWLDRVDSNLFALPVVYMLVTSFGPH
jgi:phosphatidate cytidylyltransferase